MHFLDEIHLNHYRQCHLLHHNGYLKCHPMLTAQPRSPFCLNWRLILPHCRNGVIRYKGRIWLGHNVALQSQPLRYLKPFIPVLWEATPVFQQHIRNCASCSFGRECLLQQQLSFVLATYASELNQIVPARLDSFSRCPFRLQLGRS